ncbi:MAG: hypothetical protein GX230_08865, partial [Lentisphaerae bacterium]|nr:hypothetical protein [Lentisphaerota bacterium]
MVNGDAEIMGGTWTHTANSGGDVEVERLCVTVGGNFTLGTNATINLNGRGYAAARGPGAGNNSTTTSGRSASHGGLGAENVAGKSTYGSAAWPENLGSGAYSAGGGALKLTVGGTATINGEISAKGSNAASNNNYCHGAGGSILIVADTIGGTGNISAGIDVSVRKSYHGSGGGRAALHALASADFTGLTLDAYAYTSQRSGYNGGAGTIFLSDPNGARLIIDQGGHAARADAYTEIPATLAELDLDPAFGGELADALLVVTNNGNASLTRDLRIGGVAWVNGSIRLNSWTLYNKADTPVGSFPADYGNGTITPNGVFYTFDDGTALTRAGRLFWGDSNVTWRVESLAYPVAGGTATFDGGQTANFYAHGSTPEFTAVPETGYDFLLWDGTLDSGSSTIANPLALAPLSGNKALRAWFLDAGRDLSTNTWSGTPSNTDWFDPRNWSLATIPVTAQTAIIPTGANVILTNITPRLAELLLSGGTFSFDGWESRLCADKISLNSGTMTHQQNTATAVNTEGEWVPNARVHIDCTDLTLAKTAKINVDAKGYLGGPANSGISGRGPGGGKYKGGYTAAAGYGGYGAVSSGYTHAPNALPYGNPLAPTDPGSGGCGSSYGAGGNGGGAVYIKASNSANIHGSISANGGNYGGNHASGGSGGAIYIECGRLYSDSGSFIANGGIGQNNGFAGGGGRIAIAYSSASQLVADLQSVTFDTSPGSESGTADIGSLAFTDAKALHSAEVRLIGQVYNLPLWE